MTQLVFWGLIRRELPAFISVPLHISIGVHAKGEVDPFLQTSPSSGSLSLLHAGGRKDGKSLAEIVWFSKDATVCCG